MIRFSTGLRNALAAEFGLGAMMNGGVMRVYGGTMPDSPDRAPGTSLLGMITTEGKIFYHSSDPNDAGLLLQLVSPGTLLNYGDWRLTGSGTGNATWFRWHWAWEDDLGESEYYPRIDGDVGLHDSLAALRLSSVSVTPTTNRLLEQFLLMLPMEGT